MNWEYLEICDGPEKMVKKPPNKPTTSFLRCTHNGDPGKKKVIQDTKTLFWYHLQTILQDIVFTEVTHTAFLYFLSYYCLLSTYYRGQCLDDVCADK